MGLYLVCLPVMAFVGLLSLFDFLRSPLMSRKIEGRYLTLAAFGMVASSAMIWAVLVRDVVPSPYMDEIFHIPQAKLYCQGRIFEWDPMITTPPGLYLVPLVVAQITSLFSQGALLNAICYVTSLRLQNLIALCLLFWVALTCRHKIERLHHNAHLGAEPLSQLSHYSVHTAMNICLFPMLLFFSGLYYTDVMSTLLVLVAFNNSLDRLSTRKSSFLSDLWTIFLGVSTLFMRQTNIFWVVVFMGGMEAVHSIKMLLPKARHGQTHLPDFSAQFKYWLGRRAIGDIVDPPLDIVQPIGFLECIMSISVAAVCNPIQILRQIWPHITIMGLFAGFVAWNGGVVLGDKSNHVATIHLTQMLYIWPMAALFSWPLWTPAFLEVIKGLARAWDHLTLPRRHNSAVQRPAMAYPRTALPPWVYLVLRFASACCLAVVIVHSNTIIHPFTLADNRHYMFYVFRYTIRRSYLLRMALVPIYILSAWLCWMSLVPCADFIGDRVTPQGRSDCSNTLSQPASKNQRQTGNTNCYPDPDEIKAIPFNNLEISYINGTASHAAFEPAYTSTAILLLLATTLSLMTAPLVEPRYFIIPWVLWRLYCPAWRAHEHMYTIPGVSLANAPNMGWYFMVGSRLDIRATMETFSLMIWNVLTMAMFLYAPFLWKAEDGTVMDEGRWQRFIW